MQQISLREFRTRGAKALESVRSGETILLASQNGPAYFLVPVMGDIAVEDRELRRAMATASLRSNWRAALAADPNEAAVDAEIEAEIDSVRRARVISASR
jgi:antitoxin (DNA-binding transcriptional repressor) of toxin-antitoxin stability system